VVDEEVFVHRTAEGAATDVSPSESGPNTTCAEIESVKKSGEYQFQYHFNRRFHLADMLDRFARRHRSQPRPYPHSDLRKQRPNLGELDKFASILKVPPLRSRG
jgi:hypothetical protein